LKDGAKPAGTKPPVKKSVKSSTGESSADEDPFISVKSKGAFIDPMKKYEAPPPATKVKTDFINPCKEYPLPINKSKLLLSRFWASNH
jgi:hypothetical protein